MPAPCSLTQRLNGESIYIRHATYPATAGSTCNNFKKRDEKERTKEGENQSKNGSRQEAKPSTPTLAIGVLIGEEEKKKETGSGFPTQLPGIILSPLTTCMDSPAHRGLSLRKTCKI